MRQLRFVLVAAAGGLIVGVHAAPAGAFVCTSAISSARATAIMGVPAQVTTGGGGEDDCGISARGYNHIIITGYVVKRSFFDDVRRKTRSGTRVVEGIRVEYTQRALQGFGAPAFSSDIKSYYENAPGGSVITRAVFVYRNGRMLRPIATGPGPGKVASVAQLVQIARLAARGI
jgi:hypothetical protein